jgi:hypothetical protein
MALIWTVLVALGTWYFALRRMETKYAKIPGNNKGFRLQSEAEKCMDERKEAENAIIRVLRRMEKRMTLGNTVMRKLWEANPDLPENEIQALERDFGITMTDRSFGIPETD